MSDRRGDAVLNPKNAGDLVLDLFLYAPLGFAVEARTLVPKLAERGKQQVSMARMVGQYAVEVGQTRAGDTVERVQTQARTTLTELGLLPRNGGGHPRPTPEPAPAPVTPDDRPDLDDEAIADLSSAAPGDEAPLAIHDYDSLAASQVIPRLAGLTADELEAVRAHEVTHRGRKTVLNKIAQLQAG